MGRGLKLVIVSDTHCAGRQLVVPDGDVLIHCGDLTYRGTVAESEHELSWLAELPHKHKLIIAGNHELGWESDLARNHYRPVPISKPHVFDKFPTLTYLHDSGVEIEGIKFWGSPVQPAFHNWAFQKPRGVHLCEHWRKIPMWTDVLITHGPPLGFGDINARDERFGDADLLAAVLEIKPKIHCYGHAHHGYGEYFHEGIHFINAASNNEDYVIANQPISTDVNC